MIDNNRTDSGYLYWKSEIERLGVHKNLIRGANLIDNQTNISLMTHNLLEYREWFNNPVRDEQPQQSLLGEAVNRKPDFFKRLLIEQYINRRVNLNQDTLDNLHQRFQSFEAELQTAPDITISAEKPLKIFNSFAIAVYGTITVEKGGQVEISVPTSFKCGVLKPGKSYDGITPVFKIEGKEGVHGANGSDGTNGTNGTHGHDATCDCCGGVVSARGTNGTNGANGSKGQPGNNGGNGGNGPVVNIEIQDLKVSNIIISNIGGQGGQGGQGGCGGQGGNGGKAGDGRKCAAETAKAGKGGKGGNGDDGGNGGNGGNGGKGGQVTFTWKNTISNTPNIITNNLQANGGKAGKGGYAGSAGAGGKPPSSSHPTSGGGPGSAGSPGVSNGSIGRSGDLGLAGSINLQKGN